VPNKILYLPPKWQNLIFSKELPKTIIHADRWHGKSVPEFDFTINNKPQVQEQQS